MPQNLLKELGRSMTEMLGVLALVGVLSITAIFGYSYAMNKYRATNTIDELNKYALLASQQSLAKRASLDLSELGNTTRQGYPITAYLLEDDEYFELELTQVPPKVCKEILKAGWKVPVLQQANDLTYNGNTVICERDDEDTPAKMVFQFLSDLNKDTLPFGACRTDSDCGGNCTRCEESQCVSTCVGDERCASDTISGAQVCCPKDKRAGPLCCAVKKNGMCCNTYGQCCPWYKPLTDKNGMCYTCEHNGGVDVAGVLDNCNVCPNRELSGNSCRLKCPADKPIRGYGGECHSCDEDKPFYVYPPHGECQKCSNRKLVNAYCSLPCGEGIYADKPLADERGICHACDEQVNFFLRGVTQNCAVCPNRILYGDMCALPCPSDKPMPDNKGMCYDCDTPNKIEVFGQKAICDLCPNRQLGAYYDGLCVLPCPSDKPMMDTNGDCHACDTQKNVNFTGTTNTCSLCPQREMMPGTAICSLKRTCPPETPLLDMNGKCYTCDEIKPVPTVNGTKRCAVCPNRVEQGGWNDYCILPCDEGIYEGKPLVDRVGVCHSCDETAPVYVDGATTNCKACPNRELQGVYCILKK